ncbi:HAMP domain-containing methyl-accepting chemotaxis protein [Argonema galeatum]|uniref:HAMP domain-containing methyl-accepting chemotaxis protein n=1 Tax=Argonema galeatum TaxID=2942762 RepID=UPI0023DE961A|nr:methyl-accepting chemotaxis protein [Argonema galeatum]
MKLQTRLMSAFIMMGLIVLVVAWVGYDSTSRLSAHIDNIGQNNLPSIEGLWKINEGQTQIESSERALLNLKATQADRQAELTRMDRAWEQINDGFKQYEPIPRTSEEEKLYKQVIQDWDKWKQSHEEFLQINQEFEKLGILNPFERQLQLISQGKSNSPEMTAAKAAMDVFNKLSQKGRANRVPSAMVSASLVKNSENNREQSNNSNKEANLDISQTKFWVLVGMTIGPLTAIILGFFLSKQILQSISRVVNIISTSGIEITSTVEEQERIANQQASSVNQTTTTMTELGASSRQAVEQAEASTLAARRVAHQVARLSEQTYQIGTITNIVSQLASQTNMLALNATIEAVRAGEYGKGFTVVAGEIRKLADESKSSAEKINSLLVTIQSITDANSIAEKEGGFESIVAAVNSIVISSQQISLTSKQQAIAIEQVVFAMNTVNSGAQQTASGITQTKVGIQRLNEAAQALKAMGVS